MKVDFVSACINITVLECVDRRCLCAEHLSAACKERSGAHLAAARVSTFTAGIRCRSTRSLNTSHRAKWKGKVMPRPKFGFHHLAARSAIGARYSSGRRTCQHNQVLLGDNCIQKTCMSGFDGRRQLSPAPGLTAAAESGVGVTTSPGKHQPGPRGSLGCAFGVGLQQRLQTLRNICIRSECYLTRSQGHA